MGRWRTALVRQTALLQIVKLLLLLFLNLHFVVVEFLFAVAVFVVDGVCFRATVVVVADCGSQVMEGGKELGKKGKDTYVIKMVNQRSKQEQGATAAAGRTCKFSRNHSRRPIFHTLFLYHYQLQYVRYFNAIFWC